MNLTPEQAREYVRHIASEYAALIRPELEESAEFRRQMADRYPMLAGSHTAAAKVFETILATLDTVPPETLGRAAAAAQRETYAPTISGLMGETGDLFEPATATEFFDELLLRINREEAN